MDARRRRAYLEFEVDGQPIGRVIVELFDHLVPQTCDNFIKLCTGNNTYRLSYASSEVHRIAPGFLVQMGRLTTPHAGDEHGCSAVGGLFEDEAFSCDFDDPGLVAMANNGPDSNASQFFITLDAAPHLDGQHVIFGRIIKGMNTIRTMEHVPVSTEGQPMHDVRIVSSGELRDGDDGMAPWTDADDPFPDFPQDALQVRLVDEHIEAASFIRTRGNVLYRSKCMGEAIQKYQKALRYLDLDFTSEEEEQLLIQHRNTVILNRAAVYLNLHEYVYVIEDCSLVLKADPGNSKALLRRGMAFAYSKHRKEAIEDLNRVEGDQKARARALLATLV